MEKYAHCGGFLEGATVDSAGQLWVVDLLSGRILQVGTNGTCTERANTGGQPNGAKFGPDGQLWIADKQLGLLRLDTKTGKLTTVTNSFRSEKLRGLNDLVFDKAGGVYFTEPYGSGALKPDGRLFYLPPGPNAKLQLVAGNLAFPNGVVLTGDGNTLLVGEYALKRITSLPTPSSPNDFDTSSVWATTSAGVGPDGMLMLADGTLLAANFDAGELLAFDSKGTPEVAESILARGDADMVSMARPLLADAHFVRKAAENRADEINTCIACNQACLDHVFQAKRATCLVNPQACYETELKLVPVVGTQARKIAVVGAGPAGLAFATSAAERGHQVTLFESAGEIGGQFNLAKQIPGKEEFHETIRYFRRQLELKKVDVRLGRRVTAQELSSGGFDAYVLATGVVPRTPQIEGIRHAKAVSYIEVLRGQVQIGKRVAIVGAGGIGFDVAEFLAHSGPSLSLDGERFLRHWGVDSAQKDRGGLMERHLEKPAREIWLLQRKEGKLGAGLGKTTGWIHRASLKDARVQMLAGVNYKRIDDRGLTIEIEGKERVLEVDHVLICAGQEPLRELEAGLQATGRDVHRIGGADIASELDAKRAIRQGVELAARI